VSFFPFSATATEKLSTSSFDESRFLEPENRTKAQKLVFSPFGAGSRICLGLHLARTELRLATAVFFRNCRGAKLSASMTDDMMEMENFFLVAPKAHVCKVVLP
jgi:cytochrome P450